MIYIGKFDEDRIISAVYYDASIERFYVKRFKVDDGMSLNRRVDFIGEQPGNYLLAFSIDYRPQLSVSYDHSANKKELEDELINIEEFIGVKSEKAKGKRLTNHIISKAGFTEPLPYEEEDNEDDEEQDVEVEAEEDNEDVTALEASEEVPAEEPVDQETPEEEVAPVEEKKASGAGKTGGKAKPKAKAGKPDKAGLPEKAGSLEKKDKKKGDSGKDGDSPSSQMELSF